ncbi:MAG: hypothetical protein NTW85_02510 [Methylococcales bacterium]|nr:hypothetical protein [Methylococcales bacterium]
MQKLTNVWLVIMLMLFLGISSVTQARTGNTADNTSKSKTTTSNTSKPAKTTSATNSLFSNIAKTNAAKNAWQERNKKVDTPPVATVTIPPRPDDSSTRRQEQQLADIQKQIADNNRQQKIIAAVQTAAQIAAQAALNKRPVVTPPAITPTPNNTASTISTPVVNPNQATTTPINTVTANPEKPASGGTSWFMILLIGGGIVCVIVWLRKNKTSNTNYRL